MKGLGVAGSSLFALLFLKKTAEAGSTTSWYNATSLTGGLNKSLDSINGQNLVDDDVAIVVTSSKIMYAYTLDHDSGLPEDSPTVIKPDLNAGTKRWLLAWYVSDRSIAAEWTAQQNFDESAITSTSNATAWDLDTAQCAVHILTEDTTISAPTNMNAGGTYVLRVVQAAGVYTLAWNAVFDWGAQSASAAPSASGDVIIVSFYSDGTTMYAAEFSRVEA